MSDKMKLGDRMKENYENVTRIFLPRRTNTIIRLDGKAFHTFTRGCAKPFDHQLMNAMTETAQFLCENIQGAQLAYTQSDEISLLLTDYAKIKTDAWMKGNLQKICSISASYATAAFAKAYPSDAPAFFDGRAFTIPDDEEVVNYFVWRQKDWERNSLNMLAQSLYSHKSLQGKKHPELHDLIHTAGANWNDLRLDEKRGSICTYLDGQWKLEAAPIFTKYRSVIRNLLIRNYEEPQS